MLCVRMSANILAAAAYMYSVISEPPGARVFPLYELFLTTNNSAEACLSTCSAFGYPAAGMEFGTQCCT